MAYKTAGKNVMLDRLGTLITYASLHTAFPALDANEVSGGTYARRPIAWNAASAGAMDDSTNGAVFNVPGGVTVAAVGFYSAITAGTLYADADVTDETFAGAGTYSLDDADLDLNS